jgi:ABC-type lipoprotein export system ATPase subunit
LLTNNFLFLPYPLPHKLAMPASLLHLPDVTKSYAASGAAAGVKAVGLYWKWRGETLIVGPSGSGKSTPPSSGLDRPRAAKYSLKNLATLATNSPPCR